MARSILLGLILEFEEERPEILAKIQSLWAGGCRDVVRIASILTEEYNRRGPQILAERRRREGLIRDPGTRHSVEARTALEAELRKIFDEGDRLQAVVDACKAETGAAAALIPEVIDDVDDPEVAQMLAEIAAVDGRIKGHEDAVARMGGTAVPHEKKKLTRAEVRQPEPPPGTPQEKSKSCEMA
jgi:hypothetical protein